MCTAISYRTKHHYFGRNLDLDHSYEETITVTPRKFPFHFRHTQNLNEHYAMIGMAYVAENYPLYYEATNEKGLSMAGLNFPGNADYKEMVDGMENVTPFEFIPWILSQCSDVQEARVRLDKISLLREDFSRELPLSPLHWIISDREQSLTVESVQDGMKIYENPVGILTNNPTFDFHMMNLTNYMTLSSKAPQNNLAVGLELEPYSLGMGAMGLPGDLSSPSRFVRAVFTKMNSASGTSEAESISQFFHILDSTAQQRGCVHLGDEKYEITVYSSCCDTDQGIYYYTTYENRQITAVDMHQENLDVSELIRYPLLTEQQIRWQNVGTAASGK